MKRFIFALLISIFTLVPLSVTTALPMENTPVKTIGVILPIQHQAMNEITAGFTQTLKKQYKGRLVFLIRNASGDVNLQRSIIESLRAKDVTLFVPVGTNTTLMTLSMVQNKPIVSVASDYNQKERDNRHPCNITSVSDSIPPKPQLDFIERAIPNLRQITIVHSASDKAVQDVNRFSKLAKQKNIAIQDLMVQQLSDLYSIASKISSKSQMIFIVKDNLVASGIRTLVQAANYRKIPLVTSDDGTVENGAAFALGVPEYRLGTLGAELAIQVLNGKDACKIPIHKIKRLSVFINTPALAQQGISKNTLIKLAKQMNYKTLFFDQSSGG